MPSATKNASRVIRFFNHVGHLWMGGFTRSVGIDHRFAEDFRYQTVLSCIKKLILNDQHQVRIKGGPKRLLKVLGDRLFEIKAGDFRPYGSCNRGDPHQHRPN